ncbi:MAG: PorP/SprF family type IX secretion system membrane protein [Paludibacteraceae bacterium]|nr:PorP/SprF family type IX secretion system membrane protein [Paludibacteraceae bacterium]
MRVLRFKITIASALLALLCFGQQSIEFSQYTLNLKGINPAAVGANDKINVLGTFRSQYAGFENAPITYYVSADLGFKIANTKHGAGLSFYDNIAGLYRYQDINLMYAYRIGLKTGDLALGVLVDFSTTSLNKDKAKNVESEYHDSSDPALNGDCNDFKVDLGVGVSYISPKWYAGISLLNILQPKYRMTERIYFKRKMNLKLIL